MNKVKNFMDVSLSYFTAFLLLAMTSLVVWQVFTRYVINSPSVYTEELVRIFLIWSSFIGAAYAFGSRHHMSLVFLKESFTGNKQKAIYILIDVMVLVFALAVLIRGGYALAIGASGTQTPILGISRKLVFMIAPLSGLIITFYQIINIKEDFNIGKTDNI